MGADVIDDEDVRMIERARSLSFLLESREAIFIGRKPCGQKLDGYVAAEFRIAGAPNFAHPAFTDLGDNRVLSNRRVGGNCFAHQFSNFVASNYFSLWETDAP